MTWFVKNDDVTWVNGRKKNQTVMGTIVTILAPGERAEDVLDENDQTRISTRYPNSVFIPVTYRALVRVTDANGYVTFHTPKLTELTIVTTAADKKEPTLRELRDMLLELGQRL